jgi:antitoxin VapB
MVYTMDHNMPPPAKRKSPGRSRPRRSATGRIAEPTSPYLAAEPEKARAKLFANGRSQAVRLPKEFRMPGNEVLVSRDGDRIILEPIGGEAVDAIGWPIGFFEKLRENAARCGVPDIEPMPVHFLDLEEIDPTVDWKT